MTDRSTDAVDLDAFWETAPPPDGTFRSSDRSDWPALARRYLEHAIASGTPLARAVRLSMRGQIKLQAWRAFEAEQVIRWDRGMIWQATVRMFGLPVRGADRLVDGAGTQQWKLLGLIPVMTASGPDVTRSNAGRLAAETVWLPSMLAREEVAWTAVDDRRVQARFGVHGHRVAVTLTIDAQGRLESVQLPRWGDPGDGPFREARFGGFAEEERTVGGYTIPSRLRIGWYPGTERFATEGEFFRATVDRVTFR